MSVNNVNSLYQTQGVQGSTSYTTLSQDDGGGVDIGKLLLGGLGTVVTIGLGVAAYKSGKQSSLTKESDNVFTTMCNGVKNWLGKNGDDVAGTLDNIPQEYRTSLKTLFSGGTLNQTELDDLYNNRKVLSDFITNTKVSNNTRKMDIVEELRKHLDDKKLEAPDDTAKLLNQLLSKDGTEIFRFENNAITLIDDANEVLVAKARKLGILSNDNKFNKSIDLNSLHSKYSAKHNNYQNMANWIDTSGTSDELNYRLTKKMFETNNIKNSFKPLFSRYSDMANDATLNSIDDANKFVLYTAKLDKYHKAGSLTNDEYNNLMAQAENTFMESNKDNYLKYMTRNVKVDSKEITDFTKLNKKAVAALNNEFGLTLKENDSLDASTLYNAKWSKDETIATYLGKQGHQLPQGWTIEGSNLNFKGKTKPTTFLNGVKIPNWETYANKTAGQATGYTISFEELKKILKPTATPSK